MMYGPNENNIYRRAVICVDKSLKEVKQPIAG